MRFTAPINILTASHAHLHSNVQVGQWVYAGDTIAKGQFLGISHHGTVIVAWHQTRDYPEKVQKLRKYALTNR